MHSSYLLFNQDVVSQYENVLAYEINLIDKLDRLDRRLQIMVLYSVYRFGSEGVKDGSLCKIDEKLISSVKSILDSCKDEDEFYYLDDDHYLKNSLIKILDSASDFFFHFAYKFMSRVRYRNYEELKEVIHNTYMSVYKELQLRIDKATGIPYIFEKNDLKSEWINHRKNHNLSHAGLYVFLHSLRRQRRLASKLHGKASVDFFFAEYIRTEYIIDMIKPINPEFAFDLEHLFLPVSKYFDENIAPYLALELINDNNYKNIEIPDVAKHSLRLYKQYARDEGLIVKHEEE